MVAQQVNQTHLRLEISKTFSDAAMRTQAEGHVGVGRVELAILGRESFRQKFSRLRKVLEKGSRWVMYAKCISTHLGIHVQGIAGYINGHALGHHELFVERSQRVIPPRSALAIQKRQWRIHAQHLQQNHLHELQ